MNSELSLLLNSEPWSLVNTRGIPILIKSYRQNIGKQVKMISWEHNTDTVAYLLLCRILPQVHECSNCTLKSVMATPSASLVGNATASTNFVK